MTPKVAITGGAGFIGCNLARNLRPFYDNLTVIDDFSTGLKSNLKFEPNIDFRDISVCNRDDLKKVLSDCNVIVHLAARGSVPRSISNPVMTNEVNSIGTVNVLEVARETGAHVIFSSSSSVYGRNATLPKEEKMWLGPLNPYAASKLSAESYVEAYGKTYNFPTTTFRFFNVFGPWQRPDHPYSAVIPKWIWSAIHEKQIEIHGDGSQTRDFTYVETVVQVLQQTIEKAVKFDGPINLAYGNKVSLNEIIEVLKKKFPTLKYLHVESRKGDIKDSQNNPKLLESLFPDIKPTDFQIALNQTIDWLKDFGEEIANGPIPSD
jgi:UDP-glucose 4-epimerase